MMDSQNMADNIVSDEHSRSNFNLYVIRLQNDKYFIHVSLYELSDDIFLECRVLYDFVKRNLPLQIIHKYEMVVLSNIDKIVKNYMLLYGIHNVRGGSYVDTDLPDNFQFLIEEEIKTMTKRYHENHHFIQKVVGNIPYYKDAAPDTNFPNIRTPSPENSVWKSDGILSNEAIEHNRIENLNSIEKYQSLVAFYKNIAEFSYQDITMLISRDFLKELAWLIEKCDPSQEITLSDKDKYKYVIFYIKQIIASFFYMHNSAKNDVEIGPNYVPFFKNPEFLFDDYIYHMPRSSNKMTWSDKKCKYPRYHDEENKHESISIYGFLKEFEYVLHYVLNRIEECEFDLSQYSDDFLFVHEKRDDYFNYLLENTFDTDYDEEVAEY